MNVQVMKEIQFNKRKYNIPQSWPEVTLRMVIETQRNLDLIPDAELVCVVSGYAGIPLEELKPAKVSQVNKIIKEMSFMYADYQPVMTNSFEFRDNTYAMEIQVQDIRFEDYISAQTILHNNRDNPCEGLPKLVATLCKLENETIDDFNLSERAEEFLDLEYCKVKDIETFFLRALNIYNQASQLSLTDSQTIELIRLQLKGLKVTMKQSEVLNGGTLLMKLRAMYFRMYLKYLERELEKYFSTILSSPLETSSNQI